MVDVDGVLVNHPHPKGWIAHLQHDLGISPAALQDKFFKLHWDDVVHGRAALRERLTPVLADIAPGVASDRLINYWFSNDAHIDDRLLDDLQSLRSDGVEVHLATVQEHERATYLWKVLGLKDKFDAMHYAAALGCSKPATTFFRLVEARTGLMPPAIFFIDDKEANVAGARDCGWTAALWTGEETLRDLIDGQHWSGG